MPRLRNEVSGVIVNVDDATAKRLGSGWTSASTGERKPAAKRTTKSDDK